MSSDKSEAKSSTSSLPDLYHPVQTLSNESHDSPRGQASTSRFAKEAINAQHNEESKKRSTSKDSSKSSKSSKKSKKSKKSSKSSKSNDIKERRNSSKKLSRVSSPSDSLSSSHSRANIPIQTSKYPKIFPPNNSLLEFPHPTPHSSIKPSPALTT